jgi:hypothetical protein
MQQISQNTNLDDGVLFNDVLNCLNVVSFIGAPSAAASSHSTLASAGTYRGRRDHKDCDSRKALYYKQSVTNE